LNDLNRVNGENKIMSEKFNGNIVMAWLPDLKGKELGAAMTKFRDALGDEYRKYIFNSPIEKIREYFMYINYGKNEQK
jgi:hypothetical protein